MSLRVLNLNVQLPILLLVLIETVILVLAPHLSTWVATSVFGNSAGIDSWTRFAWSTAFAVIGGVSLLAVGLYSFRLRCDSAGLLLRVAVATAIAAVLGALVHAAAPAVTIPRNILLPASVISVASILALRLSIEHIIPEDLLKRRVLVFGAGSQAARLLELRRRTDTRGYLIVAYVAAQGDELAVPNDRVIPRPPDLFFWARENNIDEIVVAVSDRRREFPIEEFLECRLAGIDVIEIPAFLERETGKLRLDITTQSWIVFGDGFRNSRLQLMLKRAIDVVVSATLLLPAIPIILLVMLAIRIEDGRGAPMLYRQRRVGLYNQPFDLLKLRSMHVDAEAGGAAWAAPDDPRVTKVGRFIRATRIDEVPQLVNVLRGDMSLVGPRPERPEFVEQLAISIPFYRARHAVKPGITGWAQLCYPYGSSEKDAREKQQFDLYYIKYRNVLLDLAIIIQTIEVILWQKGAR